MIFYKLSAKHKKWFIINKIIVFLALVICLFIAVNLAELKLPTNESKLNASLGFILILGVMMLAFMNRIGALFKIKSVGFFAFWLVFMSLDYIINPLKWAFGLMMIPLLIDDMILGPIWMNIWYNEYDK